MTTDVLDRLRAADIFPTTHRPPFDDVMTRLQAQRDVRRGLDATSSRPLRLRRVVPAGAVVTGALAASLIVVVGSPNNHGLPHLGVLQAAASTAGTDPASGLFSGYVQDQRLTVTLRGGPAVTYRNRTIARRVSPTEFDGTLENTESAPAKRQTCPQLKGNRAIASGDVRVTTTRHGNESTHRSTWRRPYGTISTGYVPRGKQPVKVPNDPSNVTRRTAESSVSRRVARRCSVTSRAMTMPPMMVAPSLSGRNDASNTPSRWGT